MGILRKLFFICLAILMMIPLAFASQECGKLMQPSDIVMNCTITSTWPYAAPCSSWQAAVYNGSGDNVINFTYADYGGTGYCQAVWNITAIGSYSYIVGNGDTGNIKIQGDTQMMNFTVMIFMILFNIGLFFFPFFVPKFTDNQATDYIIKHLIFIGGIMFLWLNVTLLRQMASDAGLGIDNMLSGVWWFVTLLVVIGLFAMVYTTTIGYLRMLSEAQMRERMGGDYNE